MSYITPTSETIISHIGGTHKVAQWNLLGNNKLEYICYINVDRFGNRYTTRRVSQLSPKQYKKWEDYLKGYRLTPY